MFVEKHGALWYAAESPVFEQFDEARGLLGVVFERAGEFIAEIHEKAFDPQWRIPVWSEIRPSSLLGSLAEAVDHVHARLADGGT